MHSITYNNRTYLCRDNETVLDVLLRNAVTVPFSCRAGVCHVCLIRSVNHPPPKKTQEGIKQTLQKQHYFKACQCIPEHNMLLTYDKPKKNSIPSQTETQIQAEILSSYKSSDSPPPDAEMWEALQQGVLMTKILNTFYTWVFEDPLLKPYFVGVTKQRIIEKVYSFHYQMLTGKKVFFGERPRNSHHWMVISEAIFQHRQQLMEKALRQHDLAEHLVQRWLDYEAWYKKDIVKDKPINKVLFGEESSNDGFESLVMEFSSLCDTCEAEVNVGDTVRYHTRLGQIYCEKCTKFTI